MTSATGCLLVAGSALLGACKDPNCLEGKKRARECLDTTGLWSEYGYIVGKDDCSIPFFGTSDQDLNPRDYIFTCVDTSDAEECLTAFESYDLANPPEPANCYVD